MEEKKSWLTKKKIIIIAALLLSIGTGVFFYFRNQKTNGAETATVSKGVVTEEIILTGQVQAEKHSVMVFPTSGKLAWVGVTEGQQVKKGQALASLDQTTLDAAYQQAMSNYRNYQATADQVLDTVKDHSKDETLTQKATRTTAEVNRDNAYDALRAAEYNLKNGKLYAPFAGVIASLPYKSPGVNVSFTDTIVEIVDPTSIYFEVTADQSEIVNLKDSQEVTVVLDSFQDKNITAKVSFIGLTPIGGVAGTSYKVKVAFINGQFQNYLRIGMTGDARFIVSQKESALYLPVKFVNSDKDGRYVNLGKVGNKVRVEVGIEGEEKVEIISGVKEGDVVYD